MTSEKIDEAVSSVDLDEIRAQIDEVDAEIVALVHRRIELSRAAQNTRTDRNEIRLDPERERVVIARYVEELGPLARHLPLALLNLSRGPVLGGARGIIPTPRS